MRDSDRLRDRATRLLALAIKAREDDRLLLAAEITKLATEASDQADEMGQREVQHQQPAHQAEQPQPVLQQQQPPSEGEKKG